MKKIHVIEARVFDLDSEVNRFIKGKNEVMINKIDYIPSADKIVAIIEMEVEHEEKTNERESK